VDRRLDHSGGGRVEEREKAAGRKCVWEGFRNWRTRWEKEEKIRRRSRGQLGVSLI
jgi:hypothetical protein